MENRKTLLILLLFISACSSISEEDTMLKTTNKIIYMIENEQAGDFKHFIGPPLLSTGKDDEMLTSDFAKLKLLLDKRKAQRDKINITDLYNVMGQRIVDVPIEKNGSGTPDSIYHLLLFFGPPNIYPLSKITDYQLTKGNKMPEDFREMKKPVRSPR